MTTTPRLVVLLAYGQMNLLDLTGPLQAFATANRYAAKDRLVPYEIIVASLEGGIIETSAGLPLVTRAVADLAERTIDTLIAPGGCAGEVFEAPPALPVWIGENAARARRVCSVCTGAFLLAEAGCLTGHRVTTHWAWVDRFSKLNPGVETDADKIFIQDGKVWTSAGVTAGIDLALALIEADCGHQLAIETARQLVMFVKRPGGQSQFSVPLTAQSRDQGDFADLHGWIAANLHEDLTVDRLAHQAGMTPRTFARLYVKKLGRTPAKAVEAIRLEAACRALEDTELPLKSIAAATGYGDEQALRRQFQRQLGVGPTQYRHRFSSHDAVSEV